MSLNILYDMRGYKNEQVKLHLKDEKVKSNDLNQYKV